TRSIALAAHVPYPRLFRKLPPALRHPPSFPTRRSSDLDHGHGLRGQQPAARQRRGAEPLQHAVAAFETGRNAERHHRCGHHRKRSEEHTSELQSLTNLVCRLLLEKKNTDTPTLTPATIP